MPYGDGTGPLGMGPMTGRAAGYCAGYTAPGFANPFWGGGYRGRGVILPYGARPFYGNPWTVSYYGNPWAAGYGPFWPGFRRGRGIDFGRGRGRGFRRFWW